MKTASMFMLISLGIFPSITKGQSKEQCVSQLNQKAAEIEGQIKIHDKSRFVVEGSRFSMQQNSATIYWKASNDIVETTFCPADIESVEIGNSNSSSPVGTITIKLEENLGLRQVTIKKQENKPEYTKVLYFNYLQKDPKNAELIKSLLLRLKELCAEREGEMSIAHLFYDHATEEPIWNSVKSNSYTYVFDDYYYGGCSLKLFYSMEMVSLSGTIKDDFLAIIPMDNVDEMILDKKTARPSSFWLKSGKEGFKVFKKDAKTEKYLYYGEQERLPLFVQESTADDKIHFETIIETAMKTCGGGKLRLRTID